MQIKKLLAATALGVCLAASLASAAESEVKLNGMMEVFAVNYNTNGNKDQQVFSTYQKDYGFYSGGNVFLDYALISESGLKYGAKLGLEHTFKNNRGIPVSIYLESDLGKVELGSDRSAGKKMRLTGYSASCQTAGSWDMFVRTSPVRGKIAYITNFCSFLDSKMRQAGKVEYSRKITYYTPVFSLGEMNTIQIGVSYVPDSSNLGVGDVTDSTPHTPVSDSPYKFAVRNGVSYGIEHKLTINEDTSLKTSFVGETGKPLAFESVRNAKGEESFNKLDKKFKNLNTYVVGTELIYRDISVAASYGNYNQSLTNKEIDKIGRDTHIVAGGAKYKYNDWGFSLNHFHSVHKKNKLDATTAAVEYNISKGIKTSFQTTYFNAKGKYFNDIGELAFDKSSGSLLILGTKLSF